MCKRGGFHRGLVGLAVIAALAVGCGDDGEGNTSVLVSSYSAETATAWFNLQLLLVQQTAGFTPPVASRAFGYSGVALYEALVGGMPGYQSLAGQVNELPPLPQPAGGQVYHWPAVANRALAVLTRQLFRTASAENQAAVDALEADMKADFDAQAGPAVIDRSVALGEALADAIFAWSRTDGGHEGYLHNFPGDYVPPTGIGLWVPTPPGYQSALQPYWGANRTFALTSGAACDPGLPPAYSEEPGSLFRTEAEEVYETVANLTAEQEEIARFWSDDAGLTATPPGHSISILTQVLEAQGATLDVAAEGHARLGIAVADAFICCWSTKFQYNLLRPVTYIRDVLDPAWLPPLNTPPFPEYTSGHSIQSGAMARVLTDLFGPLAFTDHTHDARGFAPREFESFFAAADEAAISRLYGGIHYRTAIEVGVDQGQCVGASASALQLRR